MKKRLFLMLLFFTATIVFAQEKLPGVRLPQTVLPQHYDLSLQIDPKEDSFTGVTRIHLKITESMNNIWIHGQDLNVSEASLIQQDGKKLSGHYTQTADDGTSRIDFPQQLTPQDADLEIHYSAPFNKRLEGLYKVEESGKAYVFTQFEAISARLCFPGFDEPSFKTPFDITLTVPSNDVAISNTLPVQESPAGQGKKQIRFARTEKLPTYLVAIAVGPFDVVKGPDIPPNEFRKTPVPLRGVAISGKGDKLKFALQNAGAIFSTLERYFGIPYAFGKLDLIAVPQFDYGAMENAGAITFREELLLLDEQSASYDDKKFVLFVMAHEMGHQWFGDLVTMAWWNDIWLNEGLTSWITNRAISILNPEYKSDVRAVQSSLNIMNTDSSPSARSLSRAKVDTSQDIKGIADGIIFAKGAAIPLMFENYIGKDAFQKFVRSYLNQHKFSNATSEDFLKALEQTSGQEIAASFRSFLFQPGVPFLQVEPKCENGKTSVAVHQSRYTPPGAEASKTAVWQIPACFRFQEGSKLSSKCTIVHQDGIVPISDHGCASWIMPNANGSGYYRWALSSKGWSDLRSASNQQLSTEEQLSIEDSIGVSFETGKLSAAETLKSFAPYASSDVREIAMAPSKVVVFLKDHIVKDDQTHALEKTARELYAPAYAKLGFETKPGDSDEVKQFRSDVIQFLAFEAEDPQVRSEASKRGMEYIGFKTDHKIHPDAVDPNLAETAMGVAVQAQGAQYLDALIELLRGSNDAVQRSRILNALGRVTAAQQVQRVLALSLSSDVRTDEILLPAEVLLKEQSNVDFVWNWLQQNFNNLVQKLSPTDAGSLPVLASTFCSEEKLAEAKEFFEPKVSALAAGTQRLNHVLDLIRVCTAKRKLHERDHL